MSDKDEKDPKAQEHEGDLSRRAFLGRSMGAATLAGVSGLTGFGAATAVSTAQAASTRL